MAIQGGTVGKRTPPAGSPSLWGEMVMMYETVMPLESKEDMTDKIIWEENTVFVMETDGLYLSSWHCEGCG